MTDFPCDKFGYCNLSYFGSNVRTDIQTHIIITDTHRERERERERDADEPFMLSAHVEQK